MGTSNDMMSATSAHYGIRQLEARLPDLQTFRPSTTLLTHYRSSTHTIIGIVPPLAMQRLTYTLNLADCPIACPVHLPKARTGTHNRAYASALLLQREQQIRTPDAMAAHQHDLAPHDVRHRPPPPLALPRPLRGVGGPAGPGRARWYLYPLVFCSVSLPAAVRRGKASPAA
jgi:hypothetical protein